SAGAANGRLCRSSMREWRSSVQRCFPQPPLAPSRSICCLIARSRLGGSTACAWKACGCMSEPRGRSPPPKPRSVPAWRDKIRIGESSVAHVTAHPSQSMNQPVPQRPHSPPMQLPLPFPSLHTGEKRVAAPPAASRVFTIPPSAPFLPTLIRALHDGRLVDGFAPGPLDFADVTIFLPTRRACRLARDTFLQVLGVEAAVLPRLVPIGDIDEDELVFADMATGDGAAHRLAPPPP